jgi:hypothetical protein
VSEASSTHVEAARSEVLLPLLFGFRDTVSGQDFLAAVGINGRALMIEEDGAWWTYGVAPGGLSAFGMTPSESHAAFRDAYRKALFDIAADSPGYVAFCAEVRRFFYEVDHGDDDRWIKTARAIRNREVEPPAPFFSALPRVNADEHRCTVEVERLDNQERHFTPDDNQVDTIAVAAEAA